MEHVCSHIDGVLQIKQPLHRVCDECVKIGATWVHLRRCAQCGKVGCCDSSPNKHATAHHRETGHPVVRSLEAGEEWFYCYEDDVAFLVSQQQ